MHVRGHEHVSSLWDGRGWSWVRGWPRARSTRERGSCPLSWHSRMWPQRSLEGLALPAPSPSVPAAVLHLQATLRTTRESAPRD